MTLGSPTIFYLLYDVFSISTMRECYWDKVRKPITTHMTNEPQLSVELFKTTHLNLRPHKWKPEKVHGWCDPEAQCSHVLTELTGCCVHKSPAHWHIEIRNQGLTKAPLLLVWPRPSYFTSLSLGFLACKMGFTVIVVPPPPPLSSFTFHDSSYQGWILFRKYLIEHSRNKIFIGF